MNSRRQLAFRPAAGSSLPHYRSVGCPACREDHLFSQVRSGALSRKFVTTTLGLPTSAEQWQPSPDQHYVPASQSALLALQQT